MMFLLVNVPGEDHLRARVEQSAIYLLPIAEFQHLDSEHPGSSAPPQPERMMQADHLDRVRRFLSFQLLTDVRE